jgi:hypothetical protein
MWINVTYNCNNGYIGTVEILILKFQRTLVATMDPDIICEELYNRSMDFLIGI